MPRQPRDGLSLSNAYRLSAVDHRGKEVPIARRARETVVQLRIPAKTDALVAIELLHDDRGWVVLPTRRTGEDVYSAFLPELGVVAAVQITDRSRSRAYAADRAAGRTALPIAVGAVLLGSAMVVLLRRRSRSAEASQPS